MRNDGEYYYRINLLEERGVKTLEDFHEFLLSMTYDDANATLTWKKAEDWTKAFLELQDSYKQRGIVIQEPRY